MFTGIIESLGTITEIQKIDYGLKLFLESPQDIFQSINVGDSLSINGVCLTVTHKTVNNILSFDIVSETLNKTNLSDLCISDKVNLEAAVKLNESLGGHIVQGHIDTMGSIINNKLINNNWLLEIMIEKKWMKYCILKGSIAIDGISLTIAKINDDYNDKYGSVTIAIIPHTLKKTNLQFKHRNDTINIETDFIAKHIEKLLPVKEKNG